MTENLYIAYDKLLSRPNRFIALYIGFNVFMESWPQIFSNNQFSSFFDSKIVNQKMIVIIVNYLRINNFRDIWKPLIMEYTLQIFLVFLYIVSELLGLWVDFL